jgi:hypothetical protein
MNVKGIYFFDNPDDHKKLLGKHPDIEFDYYYGWRKAAEDGMVIIVNVDVIKKKLDKMDYFCAYSEKEKKVC